MLRPASTLIPLLLALFLPEALPAQSLLWKIEGKDLGAPSYIYGTIHAICPDDMVITDAMIDAVGSSARIALELDLDDPRLIVEMGHHSFMPRDKTINDLFSEEDFNYLEQWFRDSIGMSIVPMNNVRPLLLIGLLIGKVLECTPRSYEDIFMAMAREQEKEVLGIETLEEQLAAFSVIPLEEQGAMVLHMVRNIDSTRSAYQELTELYIKQDINGLHQLALDSGIEYGRYDTALLTTRNQKWIPRILDIASEKPTFFAVGAGHLAGEHGLLNLLRKEGYKTTAIQD
ncbi:MAG: TraB/GumN family protein [Bacteroidetes bacterium]|nr:TraB/GumN family protein [Bacteroidota bacterium]